MYILTKNCKFTIGRKPPVLAQYSPGFGNSSFLYLTSLFGTIVCHFYPFRASEHEPAIILGAVMHWIASTFSARFAFIRGLKMQEKAS